VRFPCVHALATTPAQRLGAYLALFPSRISLPRYGDRVGLRIVLFEACSAFTRVRACTLALSPTSVTRYHPEASTASLPPQLLATTNFVVPMADAPAVAAQLLR